jgi:hypothetical protein
LTGFSAMPRVISSCTINVGTMIANPSKAAAAGQINCLTAIRPQTTAVSAVIASSSMA